MELLVRDEFAPHFYQWLDSIVGYHGAELAILLVKFIVIGIVILAEVELCTYIYDEVKGNHS